VHDDVHNRQILWTTEESLRTTLCIQKYLLTSTFASRTVSDSRTERNAEPQGDAQADERSGTERSPTGPTARWSGRRLSEPMGLAPRSWKAQA